MCDYLSLVFPRGLLHDYIYSFRCGEKEGLASLKPGYVSQDIKDNIQRGSNKILAGGMT